MVRVPYNKLLTNLASSSRTGEYWPSVIFVRTSLRSVRTATTSGQYSPVRPSRSVSKRLVRRRHVGAHPDGHQHGGRKPTETSVTEFCYKSVNLSLEELKNIKIILFPNTRTVQIAKFPEINPEISHFLTNSPSSV